MHNAQPPTNLIKRLGFFVPGEVTLVLEHRTPLSASALLDALQSVPLVQQNPILREAVAQATPEHVVVFPDTARHAAEPRGCGEWLALLLRFFQPDTARTHTRTQAENTTGQRRERYVSSLFLDLKQQDESLIQPRRLIEAFIDPQVNLIQEGFGHGESVSVTNISPNWLVASAQPILTVGGPGARPVIPNPPITPNAQSADTWGFQLNGQTRATAEMNSGRDVDVYILDTAPTRKQLETAQAQHTKNTLLQALLAPSGVFTLPNARFDVQHASTLGGHIAQQIAWVSGETTGAEPSGHDYEMRDHGLFAAGVIHSIVPDAHIHLVEVLGRWGVGTMETILQGLTQLLERTNKRPMVINLSLMLDIPFRKYVAHRAEVEIYKTQYQQFEEEYGWLMEWLDRREGYVLDGLSALEAVCTALREEQQAVIFAAAGNDSYGAKQPVDARYPAAFDSVVGVGALDENAKPASYSNKADKPQVGGFQTFGGGIDISSGSAGTNLTDHVAMSADNEHGMLGLYIGGIPTTAGVMASSSGWARWAGTSFAAPVTAAYFAALRSAGLSVEQALSAMHNLSTETTGSAQRIDVKQGA